MHAAKTTGKVLVKTNNDRELKSMTPANTSLILFLVAYPYHTRSVRPHAGSVIRYIVCCLLYE